MKYIVVAGIGIVVLGGIWLVGQQTEQDSKVVVEETQEKQPGIPIATIREHALELEIVRTPEEQSKGLSGRDRLAENTGMLFVYENPEIPGFWMPDMNFSIDIIWIDKNKKIVGIENNVAPETFPEIFRPPSPVLYVVEVNAGWAKKHGVTVDNEFIFNGVF